MWAWLLDAAKWAWSERAFLQPLFAKYANRPGGVPKFDGPAIKRAIVSYEPIVWEIVANGKSVPAAVFKVIATKLAPHKMTAAEERVWMDRGNPPG